jgi:hypothetical protein
MGPVARAEQAPSVTEGASARGHVLVRATSELVTCLVRLSWLEMADPGKGPDENSALDRRGFQIVVKSPQR